MEKLKLKQPGPFADIAQKHDLLAPDVDLAVASRLGTTRIHTFTGTYLTSAQAYSLIPHQRYNFALPKAPDKSCELHPLSTGQSA
jgi:hypothetical protein